MKKEGSILKKDILSFRRRSFRPFLYKPTLIIHAEYDHIIPFSQGQDLYEASTAEEKRMLKIPRADHNTLFQYGMTEYLNAIKEFVDKILS